MAEPSLTRKSFEMLKNNYLLVWFHFAYLHGQLSEGVVMGPKDVPVGIWPPSSVANSFKDSQHMVQVTRLDLMKELRKGLRSSYRGSDFFSHHLDKNFCQRQKHEKIWTRQPAQNWGFLRNSTQWWKNATIYLYEYYHTFCTIVYGLKWPSV